MRPATRSAARTGIDTGSAGLGNAEDLGTRWEALESADRQLVDETDAARTPEGSLSALLARRLQVQVTSAQRHRWLATALAVAEKRIDAVVSGKYRRAYARAAELAVAYAESVALCGDAAGATAFLAAMNAQHPRHIAFRRELDAATRRSSPAQRRDVRLSGPCRTASLQAESAQSASRVRALAC